MASNRAFAAVVTVAGGSKITPEIEGGRPGRLFRAVRYGIGGYLSVQSCRLDLELVGSQLPSARFLFQ